MLSCAATEFACLAVLGLCGPASEWRPYGLLINRKLAEDLNTEDAKPNAAAMCRLSPRAAEYWTRVGCGAVIKWRSMLFEQEAYGLDKIVARGPGAVSTTELVADAVLTYQNGYKHVDTHAYKHVNTHVDPQCRDTYLHKSIPM